MTESTENTLQSLDEAVAPAPADQETEPILDAATDEVLRLHLDAFEGPMELLLYLIKVQEIDIFDIPIVTITEQYLRFLDMMREENLEVTGDFLVMAATLVQIKSRMLLPPEKDQEEEEAEDEDPRFELVEKLLEYRQFRDLTEKFARLEAEREKWYARRAKPAIDPDPDETELIEVSLYDLTEAFRRVLRFITDDLVHDVVHEGASVDEKVEYIEGRLLSEGSLAWTDLFKTCRSRVEAVCTFLAILELCRMGRMRAHQHHTFEEIRLFHITQAP